MFCPRCGSKVVVDQQFCRECGIELAEDAPRRRFDPRLGAFLIVAIGLIALLVAMTGKLMDSKIVVFAGIFVMVATMLFGLLGAYFYSSRPRRRPVKRSSTVSLPPLKTIEPVDTTNQLPPIPAADHFPSVTEHTTTRLKTE